MFGAQQREKIYPELGSTSGELFFPTRRVDKNSSRLFSDNLRAGATVVRMIGVRRQLRQHETTLLLMESCYLLSLVVVGNKRRQLRQHVTTFLWMESCYLLSLVVVLSVHSLVFRIGRGKMTFGSSYSCCASRRSPVRMRQNSCSVRMVSKELRDAREQ